VFFVVDCGLFFLLITLINRQVKDLHRKTFFVTCSAVLFANFYLATILYPVVASYNGQVAAANYINQSKYANYRIYTGRMESNVFQFECKKPVDFVPIEKFTTINPKDSTAFFATQYTLNYLINTHIPYRLIKSFTNYAQERILPQFVNSATRERTLDKVYLITR
jgi:hypothetical protein